MRIEDFDGSDVIDLAEERIGSVERSYVDDTGRVQFVEVKLRGLLAKHRLIPIDMVECGEGALKVPFDRDVILASPDAAAAGDSVDGGMLDQVRRYYLNQRSTQNAGDAGSAVPIAGEAQSNQTEAATPDINSSGRAPVHGRAAHVPDDLTRNGDGDNG